MSTTTVRRPDATTENVRNALHDAGISHATAAAHLGISPDALGRRLRGTVSLERV